MAGKKGKVETPIADTPEENLKKLEIPFDVGKIYADVKVTKIVPELPRSIYFVYAKREERTERHEGKNIHVHNALVKIPVTDKDGNVKKYEVAWDTTEHSMTPKDFDRFVKTRSQEFLITE